MKLSKLIKKLQLDLEVNGDVEHVGIALVMGKTSKYRLDAFGEIDVVHSEGEYVNSVCHLVAVYEYFHFGIDMSDESNKANV